MQTLNDDSKSGAEEPAACTPGRHIGVFSGKVSPQSKLANGKLGSAEWKQGLFNKFNGCEPGLAAHMCSSALPPSLTPSPITYWELGERARAQLASNITQRSTRCLRAHQGGGGECVGRVMSHGDARKTGAALGNAGTHGPRSLGEVERGKKEKEKTDSEMLRHLPCAAVPERRFVGGGKHIWRLAGNRSPEGLLSSHTNGQRNENELLC